VRAAADGDAILPGVVYVAPSDHHLVVAGERLALLRGPRENGHRPAIDPLFRSAARSHGRGVLGVVLSGSLSDGSHGLALVKAHGGTVLVQSPEEALFPSMPLAAMARVAVDHVLPIAALAETLVRLLGVGAVDASEPPADAARDEDVGDAPFGPTANEAIGGQVSPFTCPECQGTLWEIRDGHPTRFRCRVGHSYDESAYLQEKHERLESALWTALTALEESASFAHRMAERAAASARGRAADRFAERARGLEQQAAAVRQVSGTLPDGASASLPALEAPSHRARAPTTARATATCRAGRPRRERTSSSRRCWTTCAARATSTWPATSASGCCAGW
jgi:two-component system chemotaxis response regulator CheB